ncbi:serine/threonine protein kinase [Embleya hyalina]|uniref:non-specific serine/threonine protein kinase n=2 Tax=Embleya hyalina TaxID=516124 RepID=A0A401YDE8_9ACTN|nr:serine/threonine protein kinase [Embleya hyalina]
MSGSVWRAFDHRLGGYCAAKLVRPADAGLLLRVVREQGFRLEHRHVASPYTWVADGDVLIAMELFAGGSLASLIRDYGALPQSYAAAILGQLLDALDHVHTVGLLHRDVKPANVLLDVTGHDLPRCLLGDFGLALPQEGPRLTESGHVVGTPGYLPPEASLGAAPDVRRDLFALGVLAWQLLTGHEDPPDEPPTVPVGAGPLWDLVGAMTSADPYGRPESAARALARLREIGRSAGEREPAVPAFTADGEPIEVFDVLGPLPEHAPAGPVLRGVPRDPEIRMDGGPGARGSAALRFVPIPEPMPGPMPRPTAEPGPGSTAVPIPGSATAPTPVPATHAPPGREPGSPEGTWATFEPVARPAGNPRPPTRVVGRRGLLLLGGLAAMGATTAWLTIGGDPADPPTPTSPPRLTGSTVTGAVSPGTAPPPTPSATTRPPAPVAGDTPCQWYEVMTEARTASGTRVRCTYRDDGSYRWTPLGTG